MKDVTRKKEPGDEVRAPWAWDLGQRVGIVLERALREVCSPVYKGGGVNIDIDIGLRYGGEGLTSEHNLRIFPLCRFCKEGSLFAVDCRCDFECACESGVVSSWNGMSRYSG